MIHEIKTLNPSIHNLKLVCLIKKSFISYCGVWCANFRHIYWKLYT